MRTGVAIPAACGAAALASFGRAVNQQDFARWCVDFLRAAAARRNAT
jgi:hypothetical protein